MYIIEKYTFNLQVFSNHISEFQVLTNHIFDGKVNYLSILYLLEKGTDRY